jgi:hypothetical protein
MRAVITLTSSESKRLIAKAVVQMPEVKKAMESAYLLISDGTTNALIYQELTSDDGIKPEHCAIGISTNGVLCVTSPTSRQMFTPVFYKGIPQPKRSFAEALTDYHPDTVVIKGANAVDSQGFVGIITSGFDGGTIPKIIGPVLSKGLPMIVPVGLEKLVPSVPEAAKAMCGARNIDISIGADAGMYCLSNTVIVTEIEALRMLFKVEATLACCGGVGGNEGAVTLVAAGDNELVRYMVEYLEENIKGEPPIKGNRGNCEKCRYKNCRYQGLKEKELPDWLK